MHLFATLLAAALLALPAAANEVEIGELSVLDNQYMLQQRTLVRDIAQRHLGRSFTGERERDLDTLQTLLDQRLVKPDQRAALQAMGIILGDHLAKALDMHWVVYEDKAGRSRALRYRASELYLFPVTMISRRQEAGNNEPVAIIYQKAYELIDSRRPALPFQ